MFRRLRSNKGSIGRVLLAVIAAAGCWYAYRSWKAGNLSRDLSAMLADCQRITGRVSMTATDRAVLDQAYATIAQIAAKYRISAPTEASAP